MTFYTDNWEEILNNIDTRMGVGHWFEPGTDPNGLEDRQMKHVKYLEHQLNINPIKSC